MSTRSNEDIIQEWSHTGEADKEATASDDVADEAQMAASHQDKRQRKMTEKGLSAMKTRLFDNRACLTKSVHRKINRMLSLMNSSVDAAQYKEEYEVFNNTVAELLLVHNQYQELLKPEERSADDDSFLEEDRWIRDFKSKAIRFLQNLRKDFQSEHLKVLSNISLHSKKSVRSGSASQSSKASSRSSTEQAALRKAKLASLQQEKLFRIKEQALEKSRLATEQASKDLEIDKMVAMTKAELAVFEELSCDNNSQSLSSEEDDEVILSSKPKQTIPRENGQLPSRKHSTDRESGTESTEKNGMTAWAEKLNETMKQSQMPKLELKAFSGDPLEFQQWLTSFEKLIEEMTSDPARRLHYLSQFTCGDANTLVAGHILGQTSEDYENAKEELKHEYGNSYVLARAYIKKIESWPTIKANDSAALKSLNVFLKKCKGSMPSLRHLQQLETDLYMQMIVSKLPYSIQGSWRKTISRYETSKESASFAKLVSFIDEQTRQASHPVYSVEAFAELETRKKSTDVGRSQSRLGKNETFKPKAKSLVTSVKPSSTNTRGSITNTSTESTLIEHCPMCNNSTHDLDDCRRYLQMSLEERRRFLIEKSLCFACYSPTTRNHSARSCRQRRTCRQCNKMHPTGLHGSKPIRPESNQLENTDPKALLNLATGIMSSRPSDDGDVSMSIVMVRLSNINNLCQEQIVYAALDTLSSACFIDENVWKKLKAPGVRTEISVKTMSGERRQESYAVDGLCVRSINDDIAIQLPKTYTQDGLPIERNEIPSHAMLSKWSHLTTLIREIPDRNESIPIGLIIGANCSRALEPRNVISSISDDSPYAFETLLGWCVSGPMVPNPIKKNSRLSCNRISAIEHVEEIKLKEMIISMYEHDFNEPCSSDLCQNWPPFSQSNSALSIEDKRFIQLMETECKLVDGHYELPLPFRKQNVNLPNNYNQALQRLNGLRKRFERDKQYKDEYTIFIKDIVDKGYARKILTNSSENYEKRWYIPHHGVYHPKKPNKIRVVFDCSCRYGGTSLNKELLQGPNLTNLLVGVLSRFRKEPIAFMADIETMFYQVRVPDSQTSYLRFLWWQDGNADNDPEEYEMCVHLFGAISSPSCCNFALKRTATDNVQTFGSETASILRDNFYVDDLLRSAKDADSAINEISNVRDMCAAGGFRLTKFLSNNRKVLESIQIEDRSKEIRNLDFTKETLPIERALGVLWCVENDTLGFRITLMDKPFTRRGILATICSIYDPLGFAAPFLLQGKQLLQRLCSRKMDWDDVLEDEERMVWEKWRTSLQALERIEINRCFKPSNFGDVINISLHHFSDASQSGYGQCSYIRLVDENGKISCSLMMGKSRVSPIKPVTIPRLELTAATVSAKVGHMLKSELQIENLTETYWTDSNVILGYIHNEAKRFHVFVANRVQLIREITDVKSWRYVDTKNNPADDSSRGLDCFANIPNSHRWFNGPTFLHQGEEEWPKSSTVTLNEDDAEVRKVKNVRTVNVKENLDIISFLEDRISDWYRLKRLVAVWLQFINYLKNKVVEKITIKTMQKAEIQIIRSVQRRTFREELDLLGAEPSFEFNGLRKPNKQLKKCSRLHRLDPFIDESGILRVGGRLRKSSLNEESKHPILLPKSCHVSTLIARWCHEKVEHSGRGYTINEIRSQGYWIIQCNSFVRSLIHKCVRCRALRVKTSEQKMADLPEDRMIAAPPFTYCGVDLFGTFIIKEGRKEVKRYGCLFTCLVCRAVHIETTNSLETDSFINALRRFIARRGNIRLLRSDQGTNIVGADTELQRAFKESTKAIQDYLHENGADFVTKRNPPTASHMGGVWERQIRSARSILSSLLKDNGSVLDDELFRTLLIEVEAIINSRPLTTDTLSDAESPIPLSPNNLLTMKSKVVMPPPGAFQRLDLYCRRRWRRVQHLANEFWSRWRKEYLTALQPRSKNIQKQRNFQIGDVVLLKEPDRLRNDWPMARVTSVHMDDKKECVRMVTLSVANSDRDGKQRFLERPITKLVLLLGVEENDQC